MISIFVEELCVKDHLTPFPYYAYMLRFWPEDPQSENAHWRFTLLDPKTGTQVGFASLESLVNYLSLLTEDMPSSVKPAP